MHQQAIDIEDNRTALETVKDFNDDTSHDLMSHTRQCSIRYTTPSLVEVT
jgi:hypothetical protein